MTVSFRIPFQQYIVALQEQICSAFEALEGDKVFTSDRWERPGGGGGLTRVAVAGKLLEGGGVNTSSVHGKLSEEVKRYLETPAKSFFACGISLVLHPLNPFVPTVHANFRYFELFDSEEKQVDAWFGGGADLTPYYPFEEDAIHFHQTLKSVCDRTDSDLYPKFKADCDRYFYNHHRHEARGIGGIFFDKLRTSSGDNTHRWYDFTTQAGDSFLKAYLPIFEARKDMDYTEHNKIWQEVRRGRYVEFNLLHDEGTRFGLRTDGRTESILMSLPPKVRWSYNYTPAAGSHEETLLNLLRNPIDWVSA